MPNAIQRFGGLTAPRGAEGQTRWPFRGSRSTVQVLRPSLILIVLAAVALVAFGPLVAKSAEPEVVARVNGDSVTRAQFERMLANPLTLRQAQQELGVQEPGSRELERLAMRKLVYLRLLVQEAGRRKISVTRQELDQAISGLRRRFGDLKDFGVWVKEQGLNDPELFETVRTDMLAERATAALVEGVRVTEEQAQLYFDAHKGDLVIGTEVRLRIIAVRDKSEAEEIVADVRKGVPFDRLARRGSMGRLAAKGGDTGWVDFHALPSLLREAAAKLKPGEVYGPLEKSKDELLIVGMQGRRSIRAKSLAEARTEIERRLLPARQQEAVHVWLKEQEEKSQIKIFLQLER
ncbi:MAG: SurA N-terminal domain-containing protein [Syntrophales bacterium]|nr:SurA N-terminal domain-containing protein [Syntrophales bacterium]